MSHRIIEARRAEQRQLIERARAWAATLDPALGIESVTVFGSVARGDFNLDSDIDVLVVADHLPARWLDRIAAIDRDRPGRVAPLAWTPSELDVMRAKRNPIALEADALGVRIR